MSITTERKHLTLNKSSINESISTWIEQDIIVPDTKPDALKIVNVHVNSYVNSCEIMDGKIKVSGNMYYYIIYRCNEENKTTRGLDVCVPFTETLNVKGVNKNMQAYIMPEVKNVIHSLPNERKISTKTEVIFNVCIKTPVNVSLIEKFDSNDDIECKTKKQKFCNIMKNKSNVIASKEDIMLQKENEDFMEFLKVNVKLVNTEYKESYNKILVKGDIEVEALYLSEEEEKGVNKLNLTVPFSGMIEIEGINDKSNFNIEYLMQDFKIRPNTDITSTKTLTIEYQIEATVIMFEKMEIEYISDFYSQTRELEYENEEVEAVLSRNTDNYEIEIKESAKGILEDDTRVVEYTVDTSLLVAKIIQDTVNIEGNLKLLFITINDITKEIDTKMIDVLVNEEIKLNDFETNGRATVRIGINSSNISVNGNDVDVKIKLNAKVDIENVSMIEIIDNIKESDEKIVNLDSMNIYIVKPGDTLWKIAKKYKTSVEKIANINNIEDTSVISVGQRILIIR